MKFSNLVAALCIFERYLGTAEYVFHAEHDVFYVNVSRAVSTEDAERLNALGFHNYHGDLTSWEAFT